MTSLDGFALDDYLALGRLEGLALSPDGRRLVTAVGRPDPDGGAFVRALWELDPSGEREPRRLTRSAKGEAAPRFTPDGALLFVSARPDPEASADDAGEPKPGLWRLDPHGGDAQPVATPPAGVDVYAVARDQGRVVLSARVHPDAGGWDDDAGRQQERERRKVSAVLFEDHPVRFWDRWYGPRELRLFAEAGDGAFADLTPDAGFRLETESFDVAPDGSAVATTWRASSEDAKGWKTTLVVVPIGPDGTPGERRTLAELPEARLEDPVWSPDGRRIACILRRHGDPETCADVAALVVDVDGGHVRGLLEDLDRWPVTLRWTVDGAGLLFTADDDGHTLPFHLDLDAGTVTRLAADGAYTDLVPAPDGRTVYALRSSVDEPPTVVALDLHAPDAPVRRLPSPEPATHPAVARHRVERVEARASDGVRVPGWLVLPPPGGEPAPLVVFIHGGPLNSWSGWHWRWNPHLLAARGWAVLLPDPALSTGYGRDYVQRGWGRWGAEPYTDIMALVDAVVARDDVDATRTAAMGGSFGGYMANWIAGHTDRFDAIVTHASLWNLEAFHGVTDVGPFWEYEFGDRYTEPERYREWSPHRFVDRIRTPMLVIHGERDFRVPVSEGLALWTDLRRHGVPSAYLHFPDENHWVLKPEHARLWYETVFAFLDHHVRGAEWKRPDLL